MALSHRRLHREAWRAVLSLWVLMVGFTGRASVASSFTAFESGQVRPLALSPSGNLLFAVNTPDNRLEVFRVQASGLTPLTSVPVGLEPVAVAVRGEDEVWVVNHLSDSVSIVALSADGARGNVVRTLLVGDEPRDIVFAGPAKARAFITAAHRGQNVSFNPQFTTPGIGRADVWVFNADNPGTSLGGNPLSVITLFSDTPRALAVTPDGSRVYAAAFHSGNRTTIVHELLVPNGGQAAGGMPGPNVNVEGKPAPETGVLVKYNGKDWLDVLGRSWTSEVKFSLPDKDVFVINANANPPAQLPGTSGFYAGVGTTLFNMAVNPVSGKVYVSNTEARNELRFEGPGTFAGTTMRGHIAESRISVLSGTGGVTARHLNKHINYAACCAALPNAENEKSLAQPLGMAVTANGATLYVAAFGSSKLGVYATAALEGDTFVPGTANQVALSGGGPTGLVLDEARGRLYVMTRFDNGLSVVNTATKKEVAHLRLFNPEPASVVAGRPFLYDARNTSSHGDSSCASCHVFGDLDSLDWNLGNPDARYLVNRNPIATTPPEFGDDPTFGQDPNFHPVKGPLSTQSLRGMANHGPMHWRGDRSGAFSAPNAQPNSGAYDEQAAFKQFSVGFTELLGRSTTLTPAEMKQFTDFMLQVVYPPNPVRNLDNSLTPKQQAGRDFFVNTTSFFHGPCESCHRIDPQANPSAGSFKGFFGTDGKSAFVGTAIFPKTPHLRNMYQKVGMFGVNYPFGNLPPDPFLGDQIRGFGFNSDGSLDTMLRFNSGFDFHPIFNSVGIPDTPEGYQAKVNMGEFMMAFDSNLAPIVGQQVTLTGDNLSVAFPRLALLLSRTSAGECDLVVKGWLGDTEVGFFAAGNGQFQPDRSGSAPVSESVLRRQCTGTSALTFTCAPPGSGLRMGVDRDLDGYLDGDERAQGSNPANPASIPSRP